MKRCSAIVCTILIASLAFGEDSVDVFKNRCGEGLAANNYAAWQWLQNNAIRTADEYATRRNPSAFFLRPEVSVIFQVSGTDAGKYHVHLLQKGTTGTSLAILRPNFAFCADPKSLDDSRNDLFTVLLVKLNGKPL